MLYFFIFFVFFICFGCVVFLQGLYFSSSMFKVASGSARESFSFSDEVVALCSFFLPRHKFSFFRFFHASLVAALIFLSVFLWFNLLMSRNLVFFFTAFELASLLPPVILILGSRRLSIFIHEIAIKYTVYNIFVAFFFVLGILLFYMTTGCLDSSLIALFLECELDDRQAKVYTTALLLFLTPFLFKLGLAPFHWLVGDIYRTLPLSYLAIYSTFYKFGVLSVFFQLIFCCFWPILSHLSTFFLFVFLFTNVFAVLQSLFLSNLRAILGFVSTSTIAMAVAPFVFSEFDNFSDIYIFASFFFSGFFVYSVILFLIFIVFSASGFFFKKSFSDIADLSLFSTNQYPLSLNFLRFGLICLFFLIAGLPPSYLFWFKFFFIEALLIAHTWGSCMTIFFLGTVVWFTYTYFRFLKILFFAPFVNLKFPSFFLTSVNYYFNGRRTQANNTHGISATNSYFWLFFFILVFFVGVLNFFCYDFLTAVFFDYTDFLLKCWTKHF